MKRRVILMTAILAGFAMSCDDDEVGTFGPNETIVGFTANYAPTFAIDQPTATLNVPVNLVSYENETFPGDVTVQVAVDEASTAQVGVDYAGLTTTSVTVPSGSTVAFIPVTVYPEALDPDAPTKLILNMTAVTTDNAIIGQQYSRVEITLQGVCVSFLSGNYSNVTTNPANGYEYHYNNEAISLYEGETTYITQYIGAYHGTAFPAGTVFSGGAPVGSSVALAVPSAGYYFTDICGKLQVPTQNLAQAYSNEVRQNATQFANSTVNEETGQITIHYSIFFTNNTVERPFFSVYTPL